MPWNPPSMTKEQMIDRDIVSFVEYLKKEYDITRVLPSIKIKDGKVFVHGGHIGIGISSDGSVAYETE
jgi:hypothetical protein